MLKGTWFKTFVGLLILLFAGLWITGCAEEMGSMGMKHGQDHDSADETEVVAVAAGASHTIELKSDGTVWAWGLNDYGQLGDGSTIDSPAPIQVSGLTDVIAIAGGDFHTVALKSDGTVWAWGRNNVGQLGNGTTTDSLSPIQVSDITGAIAVSAGQYHTLVLKTDGTAWAWGYNGSGQLGTETTEICQEWYLLMGELRSRDNPCSTTPVQVSNLTDVTAISTRWLHNIAVKTDGTVWVWGSNKYGQFGDETRTSSTTPIQVSGLTDVIAIAAGNLHSIAVKADGTVWAWGWNNFGQLGDGATWNHITSLVQVPGLTDVTAIAAGGSHSIAVKSDGTVWAWGNNEHGQLGVTTTEICEITVSLGDKGGYTYPAFCSTTPVQVDGLTNVTTTATGDDYTIALKDDGTAWTWGDNEFGQLGAITTETCGYEDGFNCSPTPVPVRNKATGTFSVGGTVSSFTTGTLVLQNNGGDDLTITANGPFTFATELEDLAIYDITILSQPFEQTCRVTSKGRINAADVTDIEIQCLTIANIAAGGYHSIALETDGTVWTWGWNYYGQLGDGTTTYSAATPVEVSGLTDVIAIAGGGNHTVAIKTDGTAWAWGSNEYGQLGVETTETCYSFSCSSTPLQVSGLSDIVAIAAGDEYTVALKTDGTVWTWGRNRYGQLGVGTTTNSTTPVQVSGLTDVDVIAAGPNHTVVLKSDGTVWAWGYNRYGQLGVETTETCEFALINRDCSTTPVQVSGLTDVTAIAAGDSHTIVLKADGTIWAWGENTVGQLGNGTTTNSITPVQVSGLTDVTAITAGIALKNDGTVWAWGGNTFGQLGVETTETCIDSWGNTFPCSTTPVQISVLTDVTTIAGGGFHTLAFKSDDTVWAWGYNKYGQLGDGTRIDSATPVQVLLTP